jgi:hypothetical protein
MRGMETLRALNAIGIILVIVGIVLSAIGAFAPRANSPASGRYNRALSAGIIFVCLGGGMLLVIYLTGLLV